LLDVLEKRIETMWHFWDQENWDFFMTHIMETDRLHHFFWEYMEQDHPVWAEKFYHFYKIIDKLIGDIILKIPGDISLMILSDHGFTTLKKEVYLNRWLYDEGFLKFINQKPETLEDIHPDSKAYSLYPGRIYINLKGREKNGSVKSGLEYEQIRQEIREKLLKLSDPEDQSKIIKNIYLGEELYANSVNRELITNNNFIDPVANDYPDLVAVANEGYDLKGNLWRDNPYEKTIFNGMHTYDDAFIVSIADIDSVIYRILDIDNL
ncbi:MAG: alkaline phosphatase family protein, partial [Calditrichaceae bacterium]